MLGQGPSSGFGESTRSHDECGNVAERDRVDDPERAESHPGGAKRGAVGALGHLDHAPVGQDQLERLDLRREVPEAGPGAMRRGGDGAGERLLVDVAEVLHRQAVLPKRPAEVGEA